MKKTILGATAAVAVAVMTTGCQSGSVCNKKGCMKMTNQEFYDGGTFDANGINKGGKFNAEKAKQAYFDMFRRLGYPVFPSFTGEVKTKDGLGFWAVDFAKGDFVKYGMGGVIWVNEVREEYFGHDIFLLPNQAIAEHRHLPTHAKTKDMWTGKSFEKDMPCKMESWLVRNGWVWSFTTEGEPNLDQYPELKSKLSTLLFEKDPSNHLCYVTTPGKRCRLILCLNGQNHFFAHKRATDTVLEFQRHELKSHRREGGGGTHDGKIIIRRCH